ncbi:MAG TPA: LuxR C-terminal-related transcriptional regulator [Candidatus Dormibacteraeota bacterium]
MLGREAETVAVDRFLAEAAQRAIALAIRGEPGIGKTALLGYAVEQAMRRRSRVLRAAPTLAEATLSFAALGDLLAETHELIARLPPPQRRALEVALLLQDGAAGRADARAVGLGLVGVLRMLSATGTVIVVIDDIQWIDAPSGGALSFALRRLAGEPIGLLISTRAGASVPAELDRRLPVENLGMTGLSIGAIHSLLTTRLGLSTPRMLLLRIHEAASGNPLVALEIGRALLEHGLPEPGEPFGIPTDVQALFAARLARLPEETLTALAVAALAAAPTRQLVQAATGRPADALNAAAGAGVIRLEGDRIHFAHPLLISAVDNRLDADTRRKLHRRIAEATDDGEERARHLALGAEAPSAEIARELDTAVARAAARSAHAVAAELATLAVKLTDTSDVDAVRKRRLAAAQQYSEAGDATRARPILEELASGLPSGLARARVLLDLSGTHTGNVKAMLDLRERAIREAVGDDRMLAEAGRLLALTYHTAGQPKRAVAQASETVEVSARTGDVALLAEALSVQAMMQIWGDRLAPEVLEKALRLAPPAGQLRLYGDARVVDGVRLMLLDDDLDGARRCLSASEAVARERGDDNLSAILLNHLAELECRAGRFEVAARCAAESFEIRDQFRFANGAHLCMVALVDACRGRADSARDAATRGLALCEEAGNEIWILRHIRVLGFLALSEADLVRAGNILGPLPVRAAKAGYGPALRQQFLPDAIEALIATGELAQAAVRLKELEEIATTLGTAWAGAMSARERGLLAAARRDQAASIAAFDQALLAHESLPDPLERGRTLLAYGQVLRRTGQRRAARALLEKAASTFEEIGAGLWLEQARGESGRIGGRTGSGQALTGAEERVAHLVSEGLTNRDVAAAMHVTERTIETHLSSIYRKLDVRSRTQLARTFSVGGRQTTH